MTAKREETYFCQSCLKIVLEKDKTNPLRMQIREKFRKEFLEILGIQLPSGYVCFKCYDLVKKFLNFRSEIRQKWKLRVILPHSIVPNTTYCPPQSTEPDPTAFSNLLEPVIEMSVIEQEIVNFENGDTFVISDVISAPEKKPEEKVVKPNPLPAPLLTNKVPNKLIRVFPGKSEKITPISLPLHRCMFCGYCFTNKFLVHKHIRNEHSFPCDQCSTVLNFQADVAKHKAIAHRNILPTNNLKVIQEGKVYIIHSPSVVKELQSDKKPDSLDPKKAKESHTSIQKVPLPASKKPETKNPLIGKKILIPAKLIENQNGLPCLDCGIKLAPEKLLNHRMFAHNISDTKDIICICDICDTEFVGKTQLISHVKNEHLRHRYIVCEMCGGLYENEGALIYHKNLQHNQEGTRYICHFCNATLPSKDALINHRKSHYVEKNNRDKLMRLFCRKFKSYEPMGKAYN